MTEERMPEEHDEKVEDLDVPESVTEDVKGGVKDGTSNTLLTGEKFARGCATGKHISKTDITV